MKTFILVMLFNGYNKGFSVVAEFTSRDKCRAAGTVLARDFNQDITWGCYEK